MILPAPTIIYIVILCMGSLIGLWHYKLIDVSCRIVVFLLVLTLLTECIANYVAVKYHNNMAVYNFFNPIELFFYSMYFNYSVDVFRKRKIGWYIGTIGLIAGVANLTLRSIYLFDSYYLLFEGLTINGMSLFALFRLLVQNDSLQFKQHVHFWFPVIFLMFWSITFLNWGIYDYFIATKKDSSIINFFLMSVNILTYLSIAIVLYRFPKMHLKHVKR